MKIIAIDIDAVWTGRKPRFPEIAEGLAKLWRSGYRFVWLTNDTIEYVRIAETALGIPLKQPVLNEETCAQIHGKTMYPVGTVQHVVCTRSREHMRDVMAILPSEDYVRFEVADSLEFLIKPSAASRSSEH